MSWEYFFSVPKAQAVDNLLNLPQGGIVNGTSLSSVMNGILAFIATLAYPLAFASLLYTAFILINSAGKPEAMATAKKNITYLAVGIFIIVFASVFVRFVTGLFKG